MSQKKDVPLLKLEIKGKILTRDTMFVNFNESRIKPGTFEGENGVELDHMLKRIRDFAYQQCNEFKGNMSSPS